MPFENFAADWLTIVESDISAVPNPGGTGGASPAFALNQDISSVLEPDGATMGTNNRVFSTSTGLDLGGVADGTVGYDRIYRDFGAPTFGNGLGNATISFEYQYWDGMARGTGYVLLGLANSSAARFYNGAGKGITPVPTGAAGWDILVDDSAGYWFGEDGSGGTLPSGSFDLVGAGFPSRTDGQIYYVEFFWDDTAKTITITEYTDATRTVVSATTTITPANAAFTAQFVVCNTNENQRKKSFSGRDQQAVMQNLDLGLVVTPIGASVENRERFNDSLGNPIPDGTKVYEYDSATKAATGLVGIIGGAVVGDGAADTGIAAAAVGVGEVVFTRPNSDTAEYFYLIPDIASDAAWVTATAYTVGARINPTGVAKLVAQVQSIAGTGTSGVTEPVWPVTKGATVIDNPGVNQITWVMADAETICTNARQGYQLGHWSAGMTAVIAVAWPPAVSAIRIAQAGAGNYALATAITTGIAGGVVPVWPAAGLTLVDGGITWTVFANPSYD